MSLTDRIAIAIELHNEGAKLNGGSEALNAVFASIPFAGGAISALLAGRAQRLIQERAADVFEAFGERLRQMEGDKVDKAFFESEEFLTLLTIALEQIQTTHDKNKLNMLATALANSARHDCSSENRKELFLRIFRDLAPEHVEILNKMKPVENDVGNFVRRPFNSPKDNDLAILQHLASQGLVTESLRVEKLPTVNFSHPGAYDMIKRSLETPPSKCFMLSDFGAQFLSFFENKTVEARDIGARASSQEL
jgi:hypothetical protein